MTRDAQAGEHAAAEAGEAGLRRPAARRPSGGRREWLIAALLGLWPFVYFLPLVYPLGERVGIGNDFIHLYYNYKVYLLDGLAHGRLPLWSPSEAAGYPFYSNPFAQAFYPLNLPLAAFYVLAGGYSPLDHQRFTVLGVSILCVGLFFWLRALGAPQRAAAVAAAVLAVSFKIAEILRFPNAVHSAAWYPWLLYAITRVARSSTLAEKIRAAALLAAFGVCLLTAGYPYYVYYTVFLLPPYAVAVLTPRFAAALRLDAPRRPLASALALLASGLAALLVCSPYLIKMFQLLGQTVDRAGASFEYSTEHAFTFEDTVGSLVYPPAAQTEGWYYFSIIALLLVIVYLVDGPAGSRATRFTLLLWIACVSAISYGRELSVFRLAWEHVPLFSRLRVWGRLNVVLVPLLAWALARAYAYFEGFPRSRTRRFLTWFVFAYAVVLALQLRFIGRGILDPYWDYFPDLRSLERRFLWFGLAGFTVLVGLLSIAARARPFLGRSAWALASLVTGLAALDMAQIGNRLWCRPGVTQERRLLDVGRAAWESLELSRQSEMGTIMLGRRFSTGILSNWYFRHYVAFLAATRAEPDAAARFLGVTGFRRIYFTPSTRFGSLSDFLEAARPYRKHTLRPVSYDGDVLVLDTVAPVPGHVSFIDNWDPDWEADVDGAPVCVERLFGTFKSVPIAGGRHRVTFRYRPRLWRSGCEAARTRSGA